MRKIREKIRSNFFLDWEWFMEIIDGANEGSEFIVWAIPYTRIVSSIDNILERTRHHNNRLKQWSNPEGIPYKEDEEPGNIHQNNISQNISHESSFHSPFRKGRKSKWRNQVFLSLYNRDSNHGPSRCPAIWHVEFWIFGDIFKRCREIWKLREDCYIFCLIFFIEFSDLKERLYPIWIWGYICGSKFFDVLGKIFFRKNLERSNIDYRRKNKEYTCNDRDGIRKSQRGKILTRKRMLIYVLFCISQYWNAIFWWFYGFLLHFLSFSL